MVLLRLSVLVYPQEQIHLQDPSSPLLAPIDRCRGNSSQPQLDQTALKPSSFLLILDNPENITLSHLAGMIKAKWEKLRPSIGPLGIRNLVNNSYPADDLDYDMTVADVFVDQGKARIEGHDQHATVRVIQKPTVYASVQFPPAEQDWDAAARSYKVHKRRSPEISASERCPVPTEAPMDELLTENITPSVFKSWHPPSAEAANFQNPSGVAGGRGAELLDEELNCKTNTVVTSSSGARKMSQELGDSPVRVQLKCQSQSLLSTEGEGGELNRRSDFGYEASELADLRLNEGNGRVAHEKSAGPESEDEDGTISEGESREQQANEDIGTYDHSGNEGDTQMGDVVIARSDRLSPSYTDRLATVDKEESLDSLSQTRPSKRKAVRDKGLRAKKTPRLEQRTSSAITDVNGSYGPYLQSGTDHGSVSGQLGEPQYAYPVSSSASASSRDGRKACLSERAPDDGTTILENEQIPLSCKPVAQEEETRCGSPEFGHNAPVHALESRNLPAVEPSPLPKEERGVSHEERKLFRKNGENSLLSEKHLVAPLAEQNARLKSRSGMKSRSCRSDAFIILDRKAPSSTWHQQPSDTRPVVCPPQLLGNMTENILGDAEKKKGGQGRQIKDYAQLVKDAEEQRMSPEYINQVRDICSIWKNIQVAEENNLEASRRDARRLRKQLAEQEKKLERMRFKREDVSLYARDNAKVTSTEETVTSEPRMLLKEADERKSDWASSEEISSRQGCISPLHNPVPHVVLPAVWAPVNNSAPQRATEDIAGESVSPCVIGNLTGDAVSVSTVSSRQQTDSGLELTSAIMRKRGREDPLSLNEPRPMTLSPVVSNNAGTGRVIRPYGLRHQHTGNNISVVLTQQSLSNNIKAARTNLKSLLSDQRKAKAAKKQIPASSPPNDKIIHSAASLFETESDSDSSSGSDSDDYKADNDTAPDSNV